MTTILANYVGTGAVVESYPHLYARSGGSITYASEAYEAFVRATQPTDLPDFVQAAERGSYLFFNANWPPNSLNSRWTRDAQAGKLIVFSAKSGGPTWAQIAQGSMDGNIDARGAQLKAFMDANPNVSLAFTFHHEPNNNDATTSGTSGTTNLEQGITNWWRAFERIVTRWDNLGIRRWVGLQNGMTITPGIIYAGPNMAGGANFINNTVHAQWYRNPNTEPWGWDTIQMASQDMYQGSANGNGTWRAFEELAGANQGLPGFVRWFEPMRDQQNAAGKVLLGSIWEFACDEWDKLWPNNQTRMFTGTSSYWNSLGIQATMPNWLHHMAQWVTDHPNVFHSLFFWDSSAVSGGQPSGRGPHMIDMTVASWVAWTEVLKYPVFGYIEGPPPPPPPPNPDFVGAISPMKRVITAA